jgi:ParB family chromosome partitioning protein
LDKVKPKTAVGRFLDKLPDSFSDGFEHNLELNSKNIFSGGRTGESLIFELPSKKKIKFVPKVVDAKKCKIWKGNIRLQEFLDEKNTADLKEKIQAQGQLIPVMARPIKNDPTFTHEVIYGSRRLYVCFSLGIHIKILEADLDDNDALLFMDAENAGREDLSPYEEAKAYKYWIESGVFKSQNELAEKLGITRSWLNKVLSLAKIPTEIITAISGPKNLSIKQGLELIKYLTGNETKIQGIIKNIKLTTTPTTVEQIIQLFSQTKENNEENIVQQQFHQAESSSKVLYSKEGQPICKITHSKQGNSILTFNAKFSKTRLTKLISEIETIIKNNF